jgi:hypothetical protein
MIWSGNKCGKKTKLMKIPGQLSPVQIMVDPKQPENVEYFNYCNSIITNDARYTREIKSRIAITRAAFYKKKTSPPNWT